MNTSTLKSQPLALILWVLTVDATAASLTILLSTKAHVSGRDSWVFVALALAGLVQDGIGRRVERVRRRFTDTSYINLTSIWTFAGAVVLPAPLVAGLTVVLYAQITVQTVKIRKLPLWRAVMNCAFVILTCDSARLVLTQSHLGNPRNLASSPGLAVLTCGMIAYFVVGAALTVPSIWFRTRSLTAAIGTPADNTLELSTLCLGAVLAAGVLDVPLLALVAIPPTALLHRGILGRQTDHTAFYDLKTSLLTAVSWQWAATQALSRAADNVTSVLMIDLDHFKSVNDTHGHLIGDDVLREVALCVTAQVRSNDLVGRFGGEEFVALLPRTSKIEAFAVADRIRQAVSELEVRVSHSSDQVICGLSVSVGVADHPEHGVDLADLLRSADSALYQAKADGRNRVVRAADPLPDASCPSPSRQR